MLTDRMSRLISWHLTLSQSVYALPRVASEMQVWLKKIERHPDWKISAWESLNILWQAMAREHATKMPEMACLRSGRCCVKQVPRVSVFELEWMATAIAQLPEDKAEALKQRCRDTVTADYIDPILGEGVACPMLGKDDEGRHTCEVHDYRPYTCRLSAVTTPMSWDCPLWEVHRKHFPTLDAELVRPFLNLFAYCRNAYVRDYIGDNQRRQMMLLGAGVLALMGEHPPEPKNPLAIAVLPHHERCSEELYLRDMPPPPDKESDDGEDQKD